MFFLRFCMLVAIALTLAPFLSVIDGRLSIFEAFAPQFGAGLLVLAAIVAFRHRVWALAGIVAGAWNLYLVSSTALGGVIAGDDGPVLRVVSLNLYHGNETFAATLDYLANSGADVIGLSEVTPDKKLALAALQERYPYSADCVDNQRGCDVMLLSKLPLSNAFAGDAGKGWLTHIARGDIAWQGRTISVIASHLFVPFPTADWAPAFGVVPPEDPPPYLPGTPHLWQSVQAADLAGYVAGLPAERIVIGDFNSVAWGRLQNAFRAATGLENRGHFVPTFTTKLPVLFRAPIDEIFTGGDLALRKFRAGPNVGSDHLPVEAEIALKAP